MGTLNQCSFIGNVGKDPEQQTTEKGKTYIRFSLAVDQGKEALPLWLSVTCWNEHAERIQTLLHKGSLVFVQGRLQVQAYTDKTGTERQGVDIIALNI